MSYKDKGLLVFGTFYMSPKKAIREFAEQTHITFPVGKIKSMAKKLGVKTIPEIIFLSKDGEIMMRLQGKMTPKELIDGIEMII